ncbi:MAG TPA: hypothetical protein DEO32_00190 [Ruminococcaceae bacterium]|nr:hypothetical protein [Oscillospiraceae bacterium]
MYSSKPSVLACVSSQYDCDRVVEAARKLANEEDCNLRVLTVIRPENDYTIISDQIEYLNLVAKEADADMTFVFSVDAADATAEFVTENNIHKIVTGMRDGGTSNSFLVELDRKAPDVEISLVDKDNTVFGMKRRSEG